MWFDPATLLVALIATISVGGLVLLWSWYEDQSEFVLAWCGCGFLLAGLGAALFTVREMLPLSLGYGVGLAAIMLGTSCAWAGARAFNRRSPPLAVMAIAPLFWLGFCLTPAFTHWLQVRASMASIVLGAYLLLAAFEFRRGDPLHGRLPLALILALHGIAVLVRIPVILEGTPGVVPFQGPWVGIVLMECMVFIQVSTVLLIALTKERLEVRLRHAAEIDPLTGLCNRRALFERGTAALAACARLGRPAAVAIFDLDDFKVVNDTFGHAAGDAVLQAFGAAADGCLRTDDILGRIGGEEFALVLPDCDTVTAQAIAHRIMARFRILAAEVGGHGIHCSASGGMATSPAGSGSIDTLLGAADKALYRAKDEGSNILHMA